MVLSKEEIDNKLQDVPFESVEEILGELACEGGRHCLVHRELRSFTFFVGWFIWGKEEEYVDKWCPWNWDFKKEYGENFYAYTEAMDDAEGLYRWACLYWIHENEYVDYGDDVDGR